MKEINSISLKEINSKNILKIIFENGPISRVAIARMLKISRPTTTSYISELLEKGIVVETGKGKSTTAGGKRATLIDFNKKAGYMLGVMIGVRSIRFALSDFCLNFLKKFKIETEEWKGSKSVIEKVVSNLNMIIDGENVDKKKIIGIGIGATGLVDSLKGRVIFSPNLKGWKGIDLKNIIEDAMGIPVFIENECRVQAIAEKKFGAAKDIENFVSIETGTGIGTGVFINNKLIIGNIGMAGEVGHIITDMASNKLCHCGNNGCLETLCSIQALREDIINDIKKAKNKDKYNLNSLSEEEILKLYQDKDEIVLKNVEKNAKLLGIGISNSIKMFNPEKVIIHGDAIKYGEHYLEIVRDSVAKNTFPKVKQYYDIQFSQLGDNVGLIGAMSFVFDNVLDLENRDLQSHYIIKKHKS